ncbi:MAG TPA: hypothetical protein VFU08_04935 [Candidatus Udaeobacter sp.]|nr:hypothetical protein [Candidatus Udaeobacter sp.]
MVDSSPRLLLTIALSLLIWVIATSGGTHVLVKEWLGEAYDSQAEHFLRGDVGVDVGAISSEAMIVNGKVRTYFGPFPAFVRIPLNFVYPPGRGRWSRVSGFLAGMIALSAFSGLVRSALLKSSLSVPTRRLLGSALVVGFILGSPILFLLGNLSIYNEGIVWGLAWSLAALLFASLSRNAEGRALTYSLIAFSLSSSFALLSRVTFGAPLIVIAPVLALRIRRENRLANFSALFVPLAAGLLFYLLLNYAKFGSFTGATYDFYIDPVHRQFAHKHGIFDLNRIPYSLADYFSLAPPSFHLEAPFLRVDRHVLQKSAPFSLPLSEVFLSLPWSSGWLVVGAIVGMVCLVLPGRANYFQRWVAAALFAEAVLILSYFALAQRYAADLLPFLIFCLVVFLAAGGIALVRMRYLLIGLIAISIIINSLATAFWLASDSNLPPETRSFWSVVARKQQRLLK